MFANPTKVGISQRVVATLVACAVVLWTVGFHTIAQAASLTNVSNTLSDSDPSATSAHFFSFTIPADSSLGVGQTVSIIFPTTPDVFGGVAGVVSGDLEVRVDAAAPIAIGGFSAAAGSISFNGVAATAGQVVTVAIADEQITNPATVASYEFEITTPADTGKTRVAIVDNVVVRAEVLTEFIFTITGVATSTTINSETTTGSTSPTLIDFGVLVANVPKVLGQRLNVTTNAGNGFVVTVESDGNLASANGAIIDNFQNGSDIANVGTAWTAPSNNLSDRTTWGHWGLTTSDTNLNADGGFYTGEFAASEFIAASTTPRVVFHHDGPSNGIADNSGSTSVAYKIEITPLQEAADDYTTTLTYIATPTF